MQVNSYLKISNPSLNHSIKCDLELERQIQKIDQGEQNLQRYSEVNSRAEQRPLSNGHTSDLDNSQINIFQYGTISPKKISHQSVSPKKGFTSKFSFVEQGRSKNINNNYVTGSLLNSFKQQGLSSLSPDKKTIYWKKLSMTRTIINPKQCFLDQLPRISAEAYCALIADNNEIITANNCDTKMEVASLTKIMTAYTVVHLCSYYGFKLRQQYITIHTSAAYMEGTSACLKADEEYLVIDLLHALLLPSGNDAGTALAQHFGKFLQYTHNNNISADIIRHSWNKFKDLRNFYDNQYSYEAQKIFICQMDKNSLIIGLKNTKFANPTGLSNKNNYSTSNDMAMLTAHCLQNHTLKNIFKRKVYTCESKNQKLGTERQVQWKNTNKHLFDIKQCIGVKTGITPNAGPCLCTAYRIFGRQIVIVIIKSASVDDRYKDAENIYRWCRKKLSSI